jgi:hypothetical protein
MQDPYTDLWRQLNQNNPQTTTGHPALETHQISFSSAFAHFAEQADAKIINLAAPTKSDHAYLAGNSITITYLIHNLEKTINRNHRDSRAFQLNAVRKKALYAISPFDGKYLESIHSLPANINTFFYRFQSVKVFYVIIGGIGGGFEKKAIYFPDDELIVTSGHSWGFEVEDLVELKARMVSNFTVCLEYVTNYNKEGRNTALCLGFYHFAHHLWNELSGVYKLYESNLLKNIDKILVMREPLGPLEAIFPEITTDKIDRKSDMCGIFNEIVGNNYFVIRVGDRSVPSDLAARIYKVAFDNCLPATRKEVSAAQQKHFPLLWVGIKLENRAWLDQATGLAQLINSLGKIFPRLGVVFDGFSLPADRSTLPIDRQEYADIIDRENSVVNKIIEMLRVTPDRRGIFNIIGQSIFDANVWAHAIDVYISPFGTLQHKVGWLANKPGIIRANRTILTNSRYLHHIWTTVQGGVMPRYTRCSSVTDVPNDKKEAFFYKRSGDYNSVGAGIQATDKRVQDDPDFANYSVDWQPLLDELLDLIRSRRSIIKSINRDLVYCMACKLKNILWAIIGFFDTPNI